MRHFCIKGNSKMKHWNKNKDYRLTWTVVEFNDYEQLSRWFSPANLHHTTLTALIDEARSMVKDGPKKIPNYPKLHNLSFIKEAKRWCQEQPGDGRFYMQPYLNKWWFEFSEDALAFKMKYE